jgi:methionyl-tRNA synthetase
VLWSLELPAPELVYAHGWITIEGEKMSKSRGNVVEPFALAEHFGSDTIRYFLLREAPFGSDFSFSDEKVRQRHNGDLGNDLGNLVKRSLAMVQRYREGRIPKPPERSLFGDRFDTLGARVGESIGELGFRDALEAIWEYVTSLNRLVDERKPWELQKAGKAAELDAVLYELAEGLRRLAILLAPFLPRTADAIFEQLGLPAFAPAPWAQALAWGGLPGGLPTAPAAAPLFPRLEAPVEE